jgi:hypothetical protein
MAIGLFFVFRGCGYLTLACHSVVLSLQNGKGFKAGWTIHAACTGGTLYGQLIVPAKLSIHGKLASSFMMEQRSGWGGKARAGANVSEVTWRKFVALPAFATSHPFEQPGFKTASAHH